MAKEKRTSVYFDRKTFKFVNLQEDDIKHLKETYKGIDVDFELNKMGLWLSTKGKRYQGNIGFILNWLSKSSIANSNTKQHIEQQEQDTPLRPLIHEYLKDLWKGREHILAFNKIRKKN